MRHSLALLLFAALASAALMAAWLPVAAAQEDGAAGEGEDASSGCVFPSRGRPLTREEKKGILRTNMRSFHK